MKKSTKSAQSVPKMPETAQELQKKPLKKRPRARDRKRALKRHIESVKPCDYHSPEFKALHKEWAGKLKESGFEDLEYHDYQINDGGHLLKGKSLITTAKTYRPDTLHYYRMWTAWFEHEGRVVKLLGESKRNYDICKWYSEGLSYRDIVKLLKQKHPGSAVSIFKLHHIIKHYEEEVFRWNKTNSNGLNFEADIEPITLRAPVSKK